VVIGGVNSLPMNDFVLLLGKMGLKDVWTYILSANTD
jgi:uncharacterized protein (DUF1697 family)